MDSTFSGVIKSWVANPVLEWPVIVTEKDSAFINNVYVHYVHNWSSQRGLIWQKRNMFRILSMGIKELATPRICNKIQILKYMYMYWIVTWKFGCFGTGTINHYFNFSTYGIFFRLLTSLIKKPNWTTYVASMYSYWIQGCLIIIHATYK